MKIQHPVLDRLRDLGAQRKSGCLLLTRREEEVRFYFGDGLIDAAHSSVEDLRLGQTLVNARLVRPTTLKRLLRRSRKMGRSLGEVALELNLVRRSEMHRMLLRQIVQILKRCLDVDFKDEGFEPLERVFRYPCRVPLDALVLNLARERSRRLVCSDSQRLQIAEREEAEWNRLPWRPEEAAVITKLRVPHAVSELEEDLPMKDREVRLVLGTLLQAGLIEASPQAPGFPAESSGNSVPVGIDDLDWMMPQLNDRFRSQQLEIVRDPHSFVSEQFKSLKIRLNGATLDAPPQVIGVSSPVMGDGKSLVCSNLALCFSQDPGKRVVLVDCDLRKPTAQDYLGVPSDPGLTHYLTESTLHPSFFIRRFRDLYVITAGRVADNPVELLSQDRMAQLVEYLRKEFDIVVLDCPPFEPISDVQILSKLTDGVVLVVRSGRTPYSSAERALKEFDPQKMLGVVFNDVPPVVFNTYYSYGYYYGDKEAYPYARKDEPR